MVRSSCASGIITWLLESASRQPKGRFLSRLLLDPAKRRVVAAIGTRTLILVKLRRSGRPLRAPEPNGASCCHEAKIERKAGQKRPANLAFQSPRPRSETSPK